MRGTVTTVRTTYIRAKAGGIEDVRLVRSLYHPELQYFCIYRVFLYL